MIEAIGLAIIAIIAAFGWGRHKGQQAARDKASADQASANTKLTKDIGDAQGDLSDDTGVLRDWLRARDPGLK